MEIDLSLLWETIGWFLVFLGWLVGIVLVLAGIAIVVFKLKIRVITVEEGTYVAFKRQGGFHYGAMQFDGYHLETNGTVVQDGFHLKSDGSIVADSTAEPPNVPLGHNWHGSRSWILRWGGWIFFIYPFTSPARYADYNDPKDGFGGNIYVRLGDVAFKPHASIAETTEKDANGKATGEHVGVSVAFTSKGRVVRPQHFLWRSPYNVVQEAVEDRQDGVLRALIYSGSVDEIQDARGNGAALWGKLATLGLLEAFNEAKNDWGLEVVPNSIVVKSVDFDADYQKALKAESQEALLAKGTRARIFSPIEGQADAWVAGQVISAPVVGETEDQAKARIAAAFSTKKAELVANGSYAKELERLTILQLADGGHLKKEQVEAIGFGADALAIAKAFGGRFGGRK